MNKTTLNFVFSGDFAACRRYEQLIEDKGAYVLGDALEIFKSAHFSFVNLECPITKSSEPIEKSGPNLKSEIDCCSILKTFDMVGLANNHIMDYGTQGLKDTIDACTTAGVQTVGAGFDLDESLNVRFKDISGVKIAVIAIAENEFNQAGISKPGSAPIDMVDNYNQIISAKEKADIVIVTLHGGNEYFPFPRPGLRKACRFYIDLGVDSVICHHPHVPGGYEVYNGKSIFYSIGNFLFDHSNPPEGWDEGYLVSLKVNSNSKTIENFEIIPYKQSYLTGGITLISGNDKTKFIEKIEQYRQIIENESLYNDQWTKYVETKSNSYIVSAFSPVLFRGIGRLSKYLPINNIFLNKYNIMKKVNLFRCQSHIELLKAAVEQKNDK